MGRIPNQELAPARPAKRGDDRRPDTWIGADDPAKDGPRQKNERHALATEPDDDAFSPIARTASPPKSASVRPAT